MGAPKIPAKVYHVVSFDQGHENIVVCVFAGREDAELFIAACGRKNTWEVEERIVHRGQPSHPGFNV